MAEKVRKGYKAFDYGMKCRGKQYAENTVFEEQGASDCCEAGVMHYCENPLDVLNYYPLIDDEGRIVEIAEVEPMAEVLRKADKCATKKLHVKAKLNLKDFIKASIDVMFENTRVKRKDSAKLASSGDSAKLASSGDYAKLASSGDYAKLASSGDSAKLASSGYSAKLASSGENSIVAGIGDNNIAKAAKGSWIVLAEWGWRDDKHVPTCVKAVQVDGETIKADTWYEMKGGKFEEVSR